MPMACMEVRSGILNIEYRLEKAKEYGIFHWENREYGIFHIPREGTEHIQFDSVLLQRDCIKQPSGYRNTNQWKGRSRCAGTLGRLLHTQVWPQSLAHHVVDFLF